MIVYFALIMIFTIALTIEEQYQLSLSGCSNACIADYDNVNNYAYCYDNTFPGNHLYFYKSAYIPGSSIPTPYFRSWSYYYYWQCVVMSSNDGLNYSGIEKCGSGGFSSGGSMWYSVTALPTNPLRYQICRTDNYDNCCVAITQDEGNSYNCTLKQDNSINSFTPKYSIGLNCVGFDSLPYMFVSASLSGSGASFSLDEVQSGYFLGGLSVKPANGGFQSPSISPTAVLITK